MRKLELGQHRFTEVIVLDEPGQGNACHEYTVNPSLPLNGSDDFTPFAKVSFQNGPIKENGVNGCHQEDLLVIVLDRLKSFQSGDFKCRENALAITKIEEAMHWLNHRTSDRQKRGVEGVNKI